MQHVLGRLVKSSDIAQRQTSDIQRSDIEKIIVMEVDKLEREYQTAWENIPLERRSEPNLALAWNKFQLVVDIMSAAKTSPEKIGLAAQACLSVVLDPAFRSRL